MSLLNIRYQNERIPQIAFLCTSQTFDTPPNTTQTVFESADTNRLFLLGFCCINNHRHFVRSCCSHQQLSSTRGYLPCWQAYCYLSSSNDKIKHLPVGESPIRSVFPAFETPDQQAKVSSMRVIRRASMETALKNQQRWLSNILNREVLNNSI